MTRAQELARMAEVAFALRHIGHDGVPGHPGDGCPRCNSERALTELVALAEAGEHAREARPFTGEPTITRADWPAVEKNFYRSPSGLWVYKWADEHLILAALGEGS